MNSNVSSAVQDARPQTGTTLAVSVVSYRTPELLAACLRSLERERRQLALDVTVTDNASGDGSAELVAERFPWARLVRNTENVGFGRAHNQALRGSDARYLLVLNADAEVQPGALSRLARYLEEHPGVGAVGPRLRYPDGRTQPSRRRFPTPSTFFLESTQLQRLFPSAPTIHRYYVLDRSDDETQDVDWLVGACVCVRGEAASQVGLFDERFFLYSEELDWCRRLRAAGWRVVYLPEAEVTHLEGGSSRHDLVARDVHFQESKLRYVEKWHSRRLAALLRGYLLVEYVARAAEETLKLVLGSRPAVRRERLYVILGYLRRTLRG